MKTTPLTLKTLHLLCCIFCTLICSIKQLLLWNTSLFKVSNVTRVYTSIVLLFPWKRQKIMPDLSARNISPCIRIARENKAAVGENQYFEYRIAWVGGIDQVGGVASFNKVHNTSRGVIHSRLVFADDNIQFILL